MDDTVILCTALFDWTNSQGTTLKKVSMKNASVRLVRDEMRQMFVEAVTDKSGRVKLLLKNVLVHKKFMAEGKASIQFKDEKCTMFVSNAPPSSLIGFLQTLFVKTTGVGLTSDKAQQKNIRAHLLSGKPSALENISPVTNAELARIRQATASKATSTTPSPPATQARKRRMDQQSDVKAPAAKKLYVPSPLIAEPEHMTDEQKDVLQSCLAGRNVFFTGSAGTGKSFLLRKIIAALPPDGTVATASTGVAACLIGGVTLHSFAGIGDGEASLQRCKELALRPSSAQAWRKCRRLVIDEVSMVDGQYFEKLEEVARHVRRTDRPFGGIQLILCGDFLQLPPIVRRVTDEVANVTKRFCFQSPAWEKCIQIVYELQIVHRQQDSEFVRILNHIRIGHVTDEIIDRLLATSDQIVESNGVLATQLCSHTADASLINDSKLEQLSGEEVTFDAQDSDTSISRQLDTQVPAPGRLVLKVGAQVMLLKNINVAEGLVNGARGIVARFRDGLPIVKFKSGKEYATRPERWTIKQPSGGTITRRQVPLKLAWAFSIHKSQGLTLDCVEMALSKVFEAGQAYVALSRAQSLDSIRVLDFDRRQVWANPDVLQFYKAFRRRLHNLAVVPLGEKGRKQRQGADGIKVKKSIMDKPLMNVC